MLLAWPLSPAAILHYCRIYDSDDNEVCKDSGSRLLWPKKTVNKSVVVYFSILSGIKFETVI